MKTLFITTPTLDCSNHVRAYRSIAETEHFIVRYTGVREDWKAVQAVRNIQPDVTFYIGAVKGPYAIRLKTFPDIKEMTRLVNIVSDAADRPWHGVCYAYRKHGCFDLQVALDGGRPPAIDHATLTAVDPKIHEGRVKKDIRCGFSGTVGGPRAEYVKALHWLGGLTLRETAGSYEKHVAFHKRCRMIFNTSWTGTAKAHHVKGRVMEAGWAHAALLEHADSPISEWFPGECYFPWRTARDAADIISDATDAEIRQKADALSHEVRTRFRPEQIYGEILEKIGVDHSFQGQTP